MNQTYTSEKTSLNQIPRLHKLIVQKNIARKGSYNFDNGAGRFSTASTYFQENGITNIPFDPFNLSQEVNDEAIKLGLLRLFDLSTTANVLNVIQEKEVLECVVARAGYVLNDDGVAYFAVYEGNKSGIHQVTTKGFQANKKLKDYVFLIQKFFDEVEIKNNIIVARKPRYDTIMNYYDFLFPVVS